MAESDHVLVMTADIVAAHVANNRIAVGDVSNLIEKVHQALLGLGHGAGEIETNRKIPAVSVRASVKAEYIVCLECGSKQKTMRRHLRAAHDMTPDDYRRAYGLPDKYPMVAQSYSEQRSEMAKSFGLGRKKGERAPRKREAKPTR